MAAVQGQYVGLNPTTGEDGVWVWLAHAKGLVGVGRSKFPAYTATETEQSYSDVLTTALQNLCTATVTLPPNDPRLITPEPG